MTLGNKSTLQIDTTQAINQLIKSNIDNGVEDMKELIENIAQSLKPNITAQFTTQTDMQAAIICEFIMS